ncbi:Aste57867_1898 [Aphanomyces stellatus]|uniref:Aste57867_1898 protein n=1 Tax=Aphanomyces stellatus TaxID=120398 RepID=A0A485K6E0_9STRA|nr:hypothetical protein As57867_001896 [Aphanomyces stellatus]VFT79105.1 Aste57867_1898 [Aphanomyces stellatus]
MRGPNLLVVASAAAAASNAWYACPLKTIAPGETASADNAMVECADLVVPLCYPGVCTSSLEISVFVKRIPAISKSAATPQAVWMLQGGPGESSVNMEDLMAEVYLSANRAVSVYTMDHRGTGRSTPLSCEENNNPYDPRVTVACIQKIKQTFGSVAPTAFSVTSAAHDLANVINLVLSTTEVFVYGLSYGTYLVERLMHLAPAGIKGYILDSIQSEQFYPTKDSPWYSNWDHDVATPVRTYLSYCDKDSYCASKIGPNATAYVQGLYALIDNPATTSATSACAAILRQVPGYQTHPSWLVNSFLYTMFKDYNQRNLVPAFLYCLNRCNTADQAVVTNSIDLLFNVTSDTQLLQGVGASLTGTGHSTVVYNNIVLSEIWQLPSPSVGQMTTWFQDALFGAQNPATLNDTLAQYCIYLGHNDPICASFSNYNVNFVYAHDAFWNKTATLPPGTSVLMFTGDLDPATPIKYAKDEYATMVGGQKLLLEFAFAPHVILSQSPTNAGIDCGTQVLTSFLLGHGNLATLNTDCITQVQKLNWTTVLDPDMATKLFGTAKDIYGPGAAGPNPAGASSSGGNAASNGSANFARATLGVLVVLLLLVSV